MPGTGRGDTGDLPSRRIDLSALRPDSMWGRARHIKSASLRGNPLLHETEKPDSQRSHSDERPINRVYEVLNGKRPLTLQNHPAPASRFWNIGGRPDQRAA